MSLPSCPKCHKNYTYEDGTNYVCPICFHEWNAACIAAAEEAAAIRDANGNILTDGDAVTVIKDLKMGGSVIKQGTKVRSIRLMADAVDGHDIVAKIDGVGTVYLKGEVVKK